MHKTNHSTRTIKNATTVADKVTSDRNADFCLNATIVGKEVTKVTNADLKCRMDRQIKKRETSHSQEDRTITLNKITSSRIKGPEIPIPVDEETNKGDTTIKKAVASFVDHPTTGNESVLTNKSIHLGTMGDTINMMMRLQSLE
jgi:hypothetical protein